MWTTSFSTFLYLPFCICLLIHKTQPLDLVRRRMQLKGHVYSGVMNALKTIGQEEGFRGFYKGMVPNAVKVNIYYLFVFF